jgi:hypothetical protein
MDIQQSFEALIRDKRIVINDISKFLQENFSEEINAGRIFLSSHGTTDKITSDHTVRDVGDLLRLSEEGKGQEGIRLANQEIQRVLSNPAATVKQRSDAYYVCALAYDITSWHESRPNKALSSQEKQANLEYSNTLSGICVAGKSTLFLFLFLSCFHSRDP